MSDLSFKLTKPFGPPIGYSIMPDSLINKINDFVDNEVINDPIKSKNLDHGFQLAGQVKQEIYLPPEIIEGEVLNFLSVISNAYIKHSTDENISKFDVIAVWVVRQFKNEYNPPHWHGGHLSGVGYLKIPENFGTTIQENKSSNPHGDINFFHGQKQFLSKGTHSKKPKKGDFYIFPNYMEHSVNPFYGDGERRSVSFNAKIDEKIYDVYSSYKNK